MSTESAPERVRAAVDETLLSLEHWHSVGTLLLQKSIPSALVVQLEQIDAMTRALWVHHVATVEQVSEFLLHRTLARDQSATVSTPLIGDMMSRIKDLAEINRYYILSSAREARWTYARQELYHNWRDSQEAKNLGSAMIYNSNAVGALGCLVAAELAGNSHSRS